ncbi:hypothetical protein [Caudoviricetes sp.]|nr:hypothetical protein [Caudoviricetes sp.]UOF81093.1 hypothetical protein [Caudoviricetes sp.]UOF82226.1 hypothetical protein [Caudoviricetes sp.]UOF82438.1 hypothetical protein [Caudoviricetes sp.]UOF82637.1 hypothetical protein [Caudoviricetes sp.]
MPKIKQYRPEKEKFDIRALRPEREYVRVQRPKPVPVGVNAEGLTGQVSGKSASDIEERFARALEKASIGFEFLPIILAPANVAGSVQLDFLVYFGNQLYPIQIDGDWIHSSAEAKAHDAMQDALVDQYYASYNSGAQPQQRIPGYKLDTQDMADALVGELF